MTLALVCPTCRSSLAPDPRAFTCDDCGARWPVVAGIPRFVSSEHYVSSFGYQWRRHRKTQLDAARSRESEETFAAKTGLRPEDVRGKLVLDVGVGTGRFADVVARWGGTPVGVDLSLAVVTANRNLARYPEAFVAQADLFKLPFREGTFDIVYSIGVLHHTPSTRDAVRAIAPLVKPGGLLVAAVYEDHEDSYDWSIRYRRYTTALPWSFLHLLCHAAVPRHHLLEAVASDRPLAHRVRRALPTSEHRDPLWCILDTFDWYSPRFQWLHDERAVLGWFHELGFEDVRREPEPTMVSVRGRRPATGPLAVPAPSVEKRHGELAPLPAWVEEAGPLRSALILLLLSLEVSCAITGVLAFVAARVSREAGERLVTLWHRVRDGTRAAITFVVVRAKQLVGIERDLLRRAPTSRDVEWRP